MHCFENSSGYISYINYILQHQDERWRIADQLVCFKSILIHSDLKYEPPCRPREMRIIDPRLRVMFIRRNHFIRPDTLYLIIVQRNHQNSKTKVYFHHFNTTKAPKANRRRFRTGSSVLRPRLRSAAGDCWRHCG